MIEDYEGKDVVSVFLNNPYAEGYIRNEDLRYFTREDAVRLFEEGYYASRRFRSSIQRFTTD